MFSLVRYSLCLKKEKKSVCVIDSRERRSQHEGLSLCLLD